MKRVIFGGILAASLCAGASAQAKDLVVGLFGGSFAKAADQCHIKPFEKASGDTVVTQQGSSSQFAAKVRATGGKSDYDVVYIDNSFAQQLASEGLLTKIDMSKVSNSKDLVKGSIGADGQYVIYQWSATVIAYNPKAYKTPPDSWADVFAAAKKGRAALPDISGTAGVDFLLAAARMNGGSIDDLAPGFKAIKAVSPHVSAYYTQADQLISMFERGEIDIAPWYPDRATVAAKSGLSVAVAYPKEGAVGIKVALVIPKGAQNVAGAEKYIDTVLSAPAQKCFADTMYEGSVNKTVKLTGDAAKAVPPEKYGTIYFPDPAKVAADVGKWRKTWEHQITH
ncbi:ABC transporter substrate-binding protein [Acidimangrovimonas sediminis]|uniref:ABC transporter substrate-binding protein n=1 Tax=Acidimangrovimonas sediminis TaxID=2056283 RepID=UPI000C809D80|nr:ABC transporter substrate-binding protein [Acidimangrovimonas sediminis]